MEIWDLYNAQRERTKKLHLRGKPIPQGLYHLVVHVWIRNSKGEYLISQRSADRPAFPSMWECAGGSALCGEDSLTAALREVEEEVGICLNPAAGRLIDSVVGRVIDSVRFSDIVDIWLFEYDGEASLSNATTGEVAQTRWMTREEIHSLFEQKKIVHTLGYFFHLPL